MDNSNNSNSRRQFLIKFSIGTGVMVGMAMTACNPIRRSLYNNFESLISDYKIKDPAATWFEITADNEIIFHSPKVEMGQGAFTGLAQAAEELVDVEKINIVHATTAGRPIDPRSTGGSDSISALYTPLRELAAGLREMLRANAAVILGVSATSLSFNNGVISGSGKSVTYGEVVQKATNMESAQRSQTQRSKRFQNHW